MARQVLAEDYGPRLDWVAVAKALDHERFNIPDQVRKLLVWFGFVRFGVVALVSLWYSHVSGVSQLVFSIFDLHWLDRKGWRNMASLARQ